MLAPSAIVHAQTIAPEFAANYSYRSLGTPPGVPPSLGGLTIHAGAPNSLLIGGSANAPGAAVYSVALTRETNGAISGWGCTPTTVHASTPYIDGGLQFGPGGVLFYSTFNNNTIGQVRPGESSAARIDGLTALGVTASTGSLQFVPPGFAGAGLLKIVSYSVGWWYSTSVTPDGQGTYSLAPVSTSVNIGGGPEGVIYVRGGNPGFPVDSVLVCEYSTNRVVAYDVDGNGDPIASTRRVFMTDLSGAEGAMVDPLTGDFLFCTFGGNPRVLVVTGFASEQSCIGDIDSDGVVTGADLGRMLSAWGDCALCAEDLNGDCTVNGLDLGVLLSVWGPCAN
ncbi:MAG: hypothetical protein JNK53_06060 [Phycisphaerae bacterium]|nr:hypothetical protein [Phycisphaerae bacterium]